MSDYWDECISIAFEDAGISASSEQRSLVAGAVQSAHENYGMAFHQPSYGSHASDELARVRRELDIERRKVACQDCKGTGINIAFGPVHSGYSQCHYCKGEGKRLP